MIYLDTSAILKLYLREEGSERVQKIVEAQEDPLPVWHLLEAEFHNALRLQVFWKSITIGQCDRLWETFLERVNAGFYYRPPVDWGALLEECHRLGAWTPRLGCRTLDLMHVAYCRQLGIKTFVTFDQRQAVVAGRAGRQVLP